MSVSKLCSKSSLVALVIFSGVIGAQEEQENTVAEGEVAVGTQARSHNALESKYDAVEVPGSVVADDIVQFSDLNLAESLQRLPSVTVTRTPSGEGSSINVRGLGPQFTRVEINGITALSSNSLKGTTQIFQGGRGFNFELLPSELFQSARVSKSPSASQSEGGLAGIVELETPRPLAYDGFKTAASLQGNYGEFSEKTDPRAALFISNNFNDVFGIAASLAYFENNFHTNQLAFGSFGPFSSTITGNTPDEPVQALADEFGASATEALIPHVPRYLTIIEDRETLGGTLITQYRPHDDLEISLDIIIADQSSIRIDDRADTPLEPGQGVFPVQGTLSLGNGFVRSGQFSGTQARIGTSHRFLDDRLSAVSFKADWQPGENWRIAPQIDFSEHKAARDLDLLSYAIPETTIDFSVGGQFPIFRNLDTDFSTRPEDFGHNVIIQIARDVQDEENSGKLDFERTFNDSALQSIKFGARYAAREFDRRYDLTALLDSNPASLPDLSAFALSREYEIDGAPGLPSTILAVDRNAVVTALYPGGNLADANAGTFLRIDLPEQSYNIEEDTFAFYVQGGYEIGKARFNAGVRVVRTELTSTGRSRPANSIDLRVVSVDHDYTEVLPSFNLRYAMRDEVILRAAYSRALARPNFVDLLPGQFVDDNSLQGTRGNPGLNPYLADQFDIGIERYFSGNGVVSVNYFAKLLDSLVETVSVTEQALIQNPVTQERELQPVTLRTPINGERAEIHGLEFQTQTPLGFLGEKFRNFSALVNATFITSDSNFSDTSSTNFTTELLGLSEKSVNATLLYDNGPLDLRLSYTWRSDFLASLTDDFDISRFTEDFGQLDFAANYAFTKNISAIFQVTNITDEQLIDTTTSRRLPHGVIELERRTILGIRVNL